MSVVFAWFLIALYAFSALATIGGVGKSRQPITAGQAVAITLINAVMCVAIAVWWT